MMICGNRSSFGNSGTQNRWKRVLREVETTTFYIFTMSCFIGLFDTFRECFNPKSITGGRDVHAAYYERVLMAPPKGTPTTATKAYSSGGAPEKK
ncbi:unnamed protein product [Amoebophrya sp. A120]|nr:unnamed protein product [Amoebophrya sp. A120]|eukprot:GSA120T00000636001.1